MGLLEGKVAFVTGAARGQGRSHAVRLAREGASIIAIDVSGPVTDDNNYAPAAEDDLLETVRLVEAEGHRIVAEQVDVRDAADVQRALERGVSQFGGRLDVVVANAGISNWNRFWEMSEDQWQTMLDVNLTGVWHTMKAAAPLMIAAGNGGSMINISSSAGVKSLPAQAHYSAAKHGVVGLTKTAAIELGEYGIRVNSIHPWAVDTVMISDPRINDFRERYPSYANFYHALLPGLPIAGVDDISDAVIWLASDLSRAVTSTQLTVDMGSTKT
ncbi:MAG: mycofactocin-coupled SDR family oxidoreductase [Actinomycetes bacterium]|jgi:SDR family mycofactocin-dependent oxidoreductase